MNVSIDTGIRRGARWGVVLGLAALVLAAVVTNVQAQLGDRTGPWTIDRDPVLVLMGALLYAPHAAVIGAVVGLAVGAVLGGLIAVLVTVLPGQPRRIARLSAATGLVVTVLLAAASASAGGFLVQPWMFLASAPLVAVAACRHGYDVASRSRDDGRTRAGPLP